MESRRTLLVLAIAAPVITAIVMGGLIIRKLKERDGASTSTQTPAPDAKGDALFALASAGTLAPDEMIRAADEADRAAGSPLVESALLRAQAARKKHDLAAERAAIDRALAIDPARAEPQIAKALFAADAWSRGAAPTARVHAPETTMAEPVFVPPSPDLEPGLDKFTGRAADIVKLLNVFRAGGKPEEIAGPWSALTSNQIEDRLAFAMGVHSLRIGSPDDAMMWLRMAVAAEPEDPSRLRSASLAALFATEAREALSFIKRWSAAGGHPHPAEALGWWAVAARKAGDAREARAKLDEAAALDPAWRCARGWLAYHTGDKKQALEDAVARRESDPWARYLRALLHWDAGEVDAALTECATLLEGTPDHYEALVLEARALALRGRNEKAEERWKHAQKLAAGRTEAKLGLAEFYAATGRREEAITLFLELPGLAVAHARGAELMLELDRHAEALRWAELGVQRYPNDVKVRVVMARVLHARLDHFSELVLLEEAAKLAPKDADVQKRLKACLEEMKRD